MGFLSDLLIRIGGDTSGLNTSLDAAGRSVKKFGSDMTSAGFGLTAGLTAPLAGIGALALKAAGDMEQTRIAFTTMLKSADAAAAHVEQLKKFTLATPFQFKDLADASRLMQAYGFAASEVVPKLRTIGNAVSALGGGRDVLERIVRSVGEIGTRGKITGEQLRELSRAGIPALEAVAKKLGVTVAEAQRRVTAGAVDAKTATDGILEYMDRRFAGGMEAQSKTLLGSWSNIKDRLTFTMVEIGNAILPIARDIVTNSLDPMLQKLSALAQGFAALPKPIQSAGLSLAGFTAALPVLILGVGTLIEKGLVIEKVLGSLGALSMAPILLGVAGAAFGASVAFSELGERTKELHKLDGKIIEQLDKWIEKHKDLRTATKEDLTAMAADAEKYARTLAGMLDFGIIGIKEYADKMKALKEAQIRIDLAPLVQDMASSGIQLRVVADQASDALQTLGIVSTAERQKNLKEAQEAYAKLRREGVENGVVLQEAALKVKAAHDALYGSIDKTREKLAAIPFAEKGLEAAVLTEQVRQLTAEHQKFVQEVAKSGGIESHFKKAAENVAEAIKLLNDAPVPGAYLEETKALEGLLNVAPKLPPELQDIAEALDAFGLASKRADIALLEREFETLGAGLEIGAVSVEQYTRAWIALMKAMDAAGEYIDPASRREVIKLEEQYGGQIKQTKKELNEYQRVADRAFNQVSRGIAQNIVDLKGFGKTGIAVAKDLATGFLEIMIQQLLNPLKDLFTKVAGHIGDALGKALGIGSSAAGTVASTAGSAAGGVGSAAGGASGAAGSAASGVMGIVGAVGAAVGAVSSVIGNFQMSGMNKSLDVLVNHTLRIYNELEMFRKDAWTRETHLMVKADDLWRSLLDIKDILGKGITTTARGGITFNNLTVYGFTPEQVGKAIFDQAVLAGAI